MRTTDKKEYVQTRMWKSTHKKLKDIATKKRISLVELLDMLAK